MTQEDILRMAREAGLISRHGCRETASDEMLERFYTLAAAAELRRLHAVNAELLEALKYHQEQTRPIERTRAAIAKAEEQK